jgi:hypothetical protein
MSKQDGLFQMTGKMGGVSFYKKKGGGHFARKASGPTRSQFLTSDNFDRTRKNLSEFGGINVATTSFMRVFLKMKGFTDNTTRRRVQKLMRIMTKRSVETFGERGIHFSQHRELMMRVELNGSSLFDEVFSANHAVEQSDTRITASLNAPQVIPFNTITAPEATTHFRVVHMLGIVSDTVYDQELKQYGSVDTVLNGIAEITFSDYLPIKSKVPADINLQTALPVTAPLPEQVSVVQAAGIMFFDKIGEDYFPSRQGIALKVVGVF